MIFIFDLNVFANFWRKKTFILFFDECCAFSFCEFENGFHFRFILQFYSTVFLQKNLIPTFYFRKFQWPDFWMPKKIPADAILFPFYWTTANFSSQPPPRKTVPPDFAWKAMERKCGQISEAEKMTWISGAGRCLCGSLRMCGRVIQGFFWPSSEVGFFSILGDSRTKSSVFPMKRAKYEVFCCKK